MRDHLVYFKHPATTQPTTLSLHDALPIYSRRDGGHRGSSDSGRRSPSRAGTSGRRSRSASGSPRLAGRRGGRSEEHTSELQSRGHLVCRLLLEKKKTKKKSTPSIMKTSHS